MDKRIYAMCAASALAVTFLGAKVLGIGIIKHDDYTRAVLAQQKTTRAVAPIRGTIYDRNLIPLTDRSDELLHITDDASVAVGKGRAWLTVGARHKAGEISAHVTGYTANDGSGLSGIEKKYDDVLKGKHFYTVTYNADAAGRPLKDGQLIVDEKEIEKPNGVRLTIDYHIQKCVEDVMDAYIAKGAAVVLDTQSFDVLAMVSRPNYDTSAVSESLQSDGGELLNRALCAYNAGSVFKIVTAAAALEGNSAYAQRLFDCKGSFTADTHTFLCHKADGHGVEDFSHSFANSCNCAFYETALFVGGKKLTDTALKLGLGHKVLGWDSEESSGLIPRKAIFPTLEIINLGIGQGDILITPLQCALMAATVANGGVRKSVNIADSVTDSLGNTLYSIRKDDSIKAMSPTTAQAIASMMRLSVTDGTAKLAALSSVPIAGKTGSAETGWRSDDGTLKVHGWFCGFFPYENPRYALAVFCEDGKSGAESCIEPFVGICEKISHIYPLKQ
ncbi:MAG: penicillin-binding protein 2 [Clostridia bacterium]|nr:penicillin-binding protein 2 [Clostridia bacterium]